ncbi:MULTISPECIES: methylmalonyl Co-A mutase-associated GTPase MeaB [unclassified Knoellia]|uniref:methylmalonyl Co-A mutase-associated GTPase MeaB n=1 Tax=Knoellia altitudinis TaxID=3404795 RepID=UPI0036231E85
MAQARRTVDVPSLVAGAREGRSRAVARLISLVEDGHAALPEVMAALAPHGGNTHVIGLTGSPGVGKSTTTAALIAAFRAQDKRVAVLAVDPSSPFSGGALLGDRIRMEQHATDPGVFIRSVASRGHLGGLSFATPQALRVLDAAGFDVVLLETVGVGQSEVEVAARAETTVVIVAPGMGDGVQAAKAGILEIGDVFVVNKADRDGADDTVRDLRHMIQLGNPERSVDWRTPVVRTVASRGDGIPDLVESLVAHRGWLTSSGALADRRRRRARAEIEAIALATLRRRLGDGGGLVTDAVASAVASGDTDVYAAAREVVDRLTGEPGRQ